MGIQRFLSLVQSVVISTYDGVTTNVMLTCLCVVDSLLSELAHTNSMTISVELICAERSTIRVHAEARGRADGA
jgi:hypothetical protein